MSSRAEAAAKYLDKIVGGQITHVIRTPDGDEDPFVGLRIFMPTTKKVFCAWIQCDEEGNGPGHLSIEEDD